MTFDAAVERLEAGFRAGLPGAAAHERLAPVPRRAWPTGVNPASVRNAAGLLLMFPRRSEGTAETATSAEQDLDRHDAHIILTVRADALRHGGQVSLPGGVVDPGETFEQAALREAHEEVALKPDAVRVLGALTPIDIPVSGFRLHPIVGIQPSRPQLTASDGEVARILEVSVDELLDHEHFVTIERERGGVAFTVPAFRVAGAEIWGATAMVLAEFLAFFA